MDICGPNFYIDLVRALLSMAQIKSWSLRQVDFKYAI